MDNRQTRSPGPLAQGESASLTRKRSLVQIQHGPQQRPPPCGGLFLPQDDSRPGGRGRCRLDGDVCLWAPLVGLGRIRRCIPARSAARVATTRVLGQTSVRDAAHPGPPWACGRIETWHRPVPGLSPRDIIRVRMALPRANDCPAPERPRHSGRTPISAGVSRGLCRNAYIGMVASSVVGLSNVAQKTSTDSRRSWGIFGQGQERPWRGRRRLQRVR